MGSLTELLDSAAPEVDGVVASSSDTGRDERAGRLRGTGALVGVLAAVVVTVLAASQFDRLLHSEPTPAELYVSGAAADPDVIRDTIAAAGAEAADGSLGWASWQVDAFDERNAPLTGAARETAVRWQGLFSAQDREQLQLVLINEPPMNVTEAERDCVTRLALGHASAGGPLRPGPTHPAVTCEVSEDAAGVVTQQITRGAQRDPEGWPLVTTDQFAARGRELWLMQQTILRDPAGTTVYVNEVVHATTWETAAEMWVLTRQDMSAIAEQINLPF